MKTYRQILAQEDEGAIPVEIYDHGLPDYLCFNEGGQGQPSFGQIFLNLMRLEAAIVFNGFHSIFDQLILPWELIEHEQFLKEIGAEDFCSYFKKCREIYFGSGVPVDQKEWDEMEASIVHENPGGPESMEFERAAELAEEAFYGKNHDPNEYIDLHKKLGKYLRKNLASMLRPEDLDL